jgi:hypothetical protein
VDRNLLRNPRKKSINYGMIQPRFYVPDCQRRAASKKNTGEERTIWSYGDFTGGRTTMPWSLLFPKQSKEISMKALIQGDTFDRSGQPSLPHPVLVSIGKSQSVGTDVVVICSRFTINRDPGTES